MFVKQIGCALRKYSHSEEDHLTQVNSTRPHVGVGWHASAAFLFVLVIDKQ